MFALLEAISDIWYFVAFANRMLVLPLQKY